MTMRVQQTVVRLGLLAAAALAALGAAEFTVRVVVGYPARPVTRIFWVSDNLGRFGRIHWSVPYAPFWNVEAGNRVFHFNNIGLPGCDVQSAPETQYIFLLGSSWVEALQVPADLTASSVLQARLGAAASRLQVLNLGASGVDPYVAWLRSRFFATRFQPARVVLVLEEFHTRWLGRHPQPLDFQLSSRFGFEEVRTGSRRAFTELREHSAFVNLVANGREGPPTDESPQESLPMTDPAPRPPERMSADLQETLRRFHQDYGDRFLLLSLLVDAEQSRELEAFCIAEGLRLVAAPEVMAPVNRFDGTGHLNERGNRELGEVLHAAIVAHPPQP